MKHKYFLIFIALFIPFMCILMFMYVPNIDDLYARNVMLTLKNAESPKDTEFVDMAYISGSLMGNGDGIDFLGAILVKSPLSEEELISYYKDNTGLSEVHAEKLKQNGYSAGNIYLGVDGTISGYAVKGIDRGSLYFINTSEIKEDYYLIYAFKTDEYPFISNFDLRGYN